MEKRIRPVAGPLLAVVLLCGVAVPAWPGGERSVFAAPSARSASSTSSVSPPSLLDYFNSLIPLCSPEHEQIVGRIAFRVARALHIPARSFDAFAAAAGLSAEEAASARPAEGGCLAVVELTVKNLHLEPIVVEEAFDFRLEDAGQNLPGWDVSTHALIEDEGPPVMQARLERGQSVSGYLVFELPEGSKNLWYAGYCKIGGTPEKPYVGAARDKIGELPGEEPVQPHRSGYKVVIGSFWTKANALAWAETARQRGLCAWVNEAYEPRGMYVVLTKLTNDFADVQNHLYIAREWGYADAYLIGRAATGR